MTHLLLYGLLALLGRVAFAYFSPYRTCRWCRPRRRIGARGAAPLPGPRPGRGRKRGCWRCRGRRLTRRLGAWHSHKVKDSIARAWAERGTD